jgi:hypothetical protein
LHFGLTIAFRIAPIRDEICKSSINPQSSIQSAIVNSIGNRQFNRQSSIQSAILNTIINPQSEMQSSVCSPQSAMN